MTDTYVQVRREVSGDMVGVMKGPFPIRPWVSFVIEPDESAAKVNPLDRWVERLDFQMREWCSWRPKLQFWWCIVVPEDIPLETLKKIKQFR
jgi:hypothetical protein